MASPAQPVGINPCVDCVFKALLGTPQNRDLLLDFLNAVLDPTPPLVDVLIQNPFHLPDFLGDDFTITDVLATDAAGAVYQIEMQSTNETALKERMLYTWADLYEGQLASGDPYSALKPVRSIWVLDRNTFRNAKAVHHCFQVADLQRRLVLTPHLQIHTLELDRWRKGLRTGLSLPLHRWIQFFSEAEGYAQLPGPLQTRTFQKAMDTLREFQTNAQWNHAYRARLDGWRRQRTQEIAFEQALAEKQQALAEKQQAEAEKQQAEAEKQQAVEREQKALAEKQQALAEREALRAKLLSLGIDPDEP